jgi:hypothetical protein
MSLLSVILTSSESLSKKRFLPRREEEKNIADLPNFIQNTNMVIGSIPAAAAAKLNQMKRNEDYRNSCY